MTVTVERPALADPWRLARAVNDMASRYGTACLVFGMVPRAEKAEYAEAARTMTRRYQALLRLTQYAADQHLAEVAAARRVLPKQFAEVAS